MSKISTKQYIKSHKIGFIGGLVVTLTPVLAFFATWKLHFKILYESSAVLFVFLAIFASVPLVLYATNILFVKNKKLYTAAIIGGILYAVSFLFLLAYAISKLFYIIYEAAPYLVLAFFIAAVLILIFLPKFKHTNAVRIAFAAVIGVVFLFVTIFGVFDLKPLYFNSGAAVFAVEDEYQIAFSTSKNTVGCVQIGDRIFYDSVGGSKRVSTVHKISVPRDLLDSAKSYTVSCRSVIRNRAYLASSGGEIEKSYSFRPVNADDGISIFNFSDNHLLRSGVQRTARYFGDDLDLIVANGDLFNDVSDEFQVTLVYKLLGSISNGSVPIIMTRGNHECVGSKLTSLPSYIASNGDKFYYTVRFGNVLFYVLDLANDMSDLSVVIRTTADFDSYRDAEIEWMKAQPDFASRADDGIDRIVALCHMPYVLSEGKSYEEHAVQLARECERIGVQLLISGHRHMTYVAKDDKTSCPYIIGGKRSDSLDVNETIFASAYTGTAIEIKDDGIYMSFVNSKCETLFSQKVV